MEINLISKNNRELIHRCFELVKDDYLNNIVLIGDLFPPCIKLTDIYGIFVLPRKPSDCEKIILSSLDKIIQNEFTLVSFKS